MSCFLSAIGELIVGQELVLMSCLQILQMISGEAPPCTVDDLEFPTLPALSLETVKRLQQSCSWGKRHTPDGFSDVWIHCTERLELFINYSGTRRHCDSSDGVSKHHLVPLNKVWPDIPAADQFRSIVVLSPLYKFLER